MAVVEVDPELLAYFLDFPEGVKIKEVHQEDTHTIEMRIEGPDLPAGEERVQAQYTADEDGVPSFLGFSREE